MQLRRKYQHVHKSALEGVIGRASAIGRALTRATILGTLCRILLNCDRFVEKTALATSRSKAFL